MSVRHAYIGLCLAALSAATAGTAQDRPTPRPVSSPGLSELADTILSGSAEAPAADGEALIEEILSPETEGLPAARDRGYLRMAVAPDPLMIAFDGEDAVGVAVALATEMEKFLAKRPDASGPPMVVVPTPTPRDEIVSRIVEGLSDFTTLTVARAEEIDALSYTQPLITDIAHVPVLGPELTGIETIDDLADTPIYVRDGGRMAALMERVNAARRDGGLVPLRVKLVDPRLADYDLMEMVEIGLIPATVASDFKANFWATVYDSVAVRDDLPFDEGGRISWAIRSNNPELLAALDGFAETAKKGTLLGNVVLKQYVSSADWIENLGTDEAQLLIDDVEPIVARFARQFGFEPALVLAQAYQESRLDQSKVSHVGALGVMQVMPATAADPVVGIPDISTVEANVNAGVKYLAWLRDTFFDDPEITPLDRTLLSFAAYNAGPGGVRRAQTRAAEMGLDPNVWFENVEVAIQRAVSREPAIYVRNIFKYYVAYTLLEDLEAEADSAREVLDELPPDVTDLPLAEREEAIEENSDLVVGEVGGPDGEGSSPEELVEDDTLMSAEEPSDDVPAAARLDDEGEDAGTVAQDID